MKKPNLIIATAWAIHAVAWFVPVIKGGVTLPNGLPGWEAWSVASCSILPCQGGSFDAWYFAVLWGISSVTTVLFLLGSPWTALFGSRLVRLVSAWVAVLGFVVNSHPFALYGSDRWDLRIGYYLWWLSFGVLAAGLFVSARKDSVIEPASEAMAAAATVRTE